MPVRYSYGARRSYSFDNDFNSRKRPQSSGQHAGSEHGGSRYSLDSENVATLPLKGMAEHPSSPGDPISCIRTPLATASYTEFDLIHHLHRVSEENIATVVALGDVFRQRDELTIPTVFSLDADPSAFSDECPGCEVYEVGPDAVVVPWNPHRPYIHDTVTGFSAVWNLIKDVNVNGTAVGRITILHQPSATSFASIHCTMGQHFDMDEMLSHIIPTGAKNRKAASYVQKASRPRPFHHSAFVFVFKYYTVADQSLTPPAWQRSCHKTGEASAEPIVTDHINVSECTSMVALAFEGQSRTQEKHHISIHSPFQVLNIRCFQDGIRTDSAFEHQLCYSGPQAFLQCLAMEFKNAVTRFTSLNEQIAELVLPSSDFIFDVQLRDRLLFEDVDYTYSRRYFWAFNCLAMVNESIRSMISAYDGTFSDRFWQGKDPSLWPHPAPDSAEGQNYVAHRGCLRNELECAMDDLGSLIASNNELKQQIESLREQLYSGSAVKENRMAIEQGENIKILTGVSMLFLPLSFVMSVFGMNMIEIDPTDWRFVVTMIGVCVPFFLLIFLMQTHAGTSLFRRMRLCFKAVGEERRQRASTRRAQRAQLQKTEMIRRQSCATTFVGEQRESVRKFDSTGAASERTAGSVLWRVGESVRGWWARLVGVGGDAASADSTTKDLHV